MNTTAEVVYRQLNNCLVNLPHALVNPLLQSNILLQSICIEFSWADKLKGAKQTHNFYTGWSGHLSAQSTTSNTPTVEIDSNFALSLNLREKTKVNIRVLLDLPRIISVELEPQTVSDWEITEIHAQFIEDRLLNQVRCVAKNQLVLAFPNSNNVIKFIVKSIKSESGDLEKGMLGNDSELHIAPKVYRRESVKDTNGNNNRRRRSVSSRRSSRSILLPAVILRGISLPHKLYSNLPQTSAYEIFINFNQPSVYPQLKNASHVQISLIPGPGTPARAINNTSIDNNHRPSMNGNTSENDHHRSNSNGNANGNSRHSSSSSLNGTANLAQLPNVPEAKKITAKLTHSSNISPGETCLSELLTVALGIEQRVGDLICIEIAPSVLEKLKSNTIVVHKYVTHTPSINEISIKGGNNAFENKKELKSKNDKLSKEFQEIFDSKHINLWNSPLTNGIKLPKIPDLLSEGGFLEFKKENKLNESNWCLFQQSGEIPRIEIGEDHLRPESFIPLNKIEKESDKLKEGEEEEDIVIGQEEIIDDVAKSLKRSSESGVLLYGSSGSGKTIISKEVAKAMFDKSGYYVKYVSCEDLPLNNFTNLKNQLVEILNEVSWHSPSLLVLENIDSIIPVEMENTDSSLSRQLSEILITKLSNLMSQRKIALLCTAKSKESLNEAVYQTHLLEDDFQLRAPDKELRKLLFKHYLAKMNVDIGEHSELLNDIGVETEGYLPLDLKILVDRSYHDLISQTLESESNNNDENEDDDEDEDNISLNIELRLSWSNVEKALENFTPSSLRGAKLQKSSVSWQDIGGLKEAKSILLETLEWPTKYAPIFANCPLRLRSGILLYGYPGCGKTLLASALAAQCGLNFISIKGPEILNKYIGASEQSVRELFERAQAAKPCILFFDEFDSIAPKRGHDSTGVTDRVVNQMLTQMDGAEGLDGVYVLAATSRPDLIDSALLRPGRLDKSVICDVPNLEDRLDILKCVTRTMKLADDVSLEDVASRCAGFSGADLQGLAYNAYLKAVHDKLEKLQLETSQNDDENNEDNNTTNNIDFIQVSQAVSTTKQTRSNIHNERIKMSVKLQQIISTYEEALSGNKSSSLSSKDKNKSNDDTNLNDEVVITPLDFEHSLKETKSSISQSELKKLQKIYDQFLNGRDGNMPDGQPSNEIGGRTTLM